MNQQILTFIENGCDASLAAAAKVYEQSINAVGDGCLVMVDCGDADFLVAVSCPGFSGEEFTAAGQSCTLAPLTHENAVKLRELFPFTAPQPVLRRTRTIGLGDRLGIATEGHIRAVSDYDITPVFAQQSIRELTLTDRTFDDVLDCVSFAVYRDHFTRGFGADGDHLKTEPEVQMAIDCGYTMLTLDCSEHIHEDGSDMSAEDLAALVSVDPELGERYLGQVFKVEDYDIVFDETELRRCIRIYKEAVDYAAFIYHKYAEGRPLDFELSIDETAAPTTPVQHYFVANELTIHGVRPATVAPRFCGEFQKGIDYIGDVSQYEAEYAVHAAIARNFGYKISIHSGSDKFSVFSVSGRLSQGHFHVKTAGTNWLEAMCVVAELDPALYRRIHAFALEHFHEAAKYYHVTTRLDLIPALDSLSDSELVGLFDLPDARQLIHITYGLILTAREPDGSFSFRDDLYSLWRNNREAYAQRLCEHIGKHLALLYSGFGA